MRLIDADALLENVQYIGEKATVDNPYAEMYSVVLEDDIINAPTYDGTICDECGEFMSLETVYPKFDIFSSKPLKLSAQGYVCHKCGNIVVDANTDADIMRKAKVIVTADTIHEEDSIETRFAYKCPKCGGEHLIHNNGYYCSKFCPDCGQAIDWSDV